MLIMAKLSAYMRRERSNTHLFVSCPGIRAAVGEKVAEGSAFQEVSTLRCVCALRLLTLCDRGRPAAVHPRSSCSRSPRHVRPAAPHSSSPHVASSRSPSPSPHSSGHHLSSFISSSPMSRRRHPRQRASRQRSSHQHSACTPCHVTALIVKGTLRQTRVKDGRGIMSNGAISGLRSGRIGYGGVDCCGRGVGTTLGTCCRLPLAVLMVRARP